MSLLPHQQRVVDEHAELCDRLKLLGSFILDNPVYGVLDPIDRGLLKEQYSLMDKLADILQSRIGRFSQPKE